METWIAEEVKVPLEIYARLAYAAKFRTGSKKYSGPTKEMGPKEARWLALEESRRAEEEGARWLKRELLGLCKKQDTKSIDTVIGALLKMRAAVNFEEGRILTKQMVALANEGFYLPLGSSTNLIGDQLFNNLVVTQMPDERYSFSVTRSYNSRRKK